MGNNSAMAFSDSEDLVNHAEYEGDEDCEVPGNWLDCYNRKKGLFYLTRSCYRLSTWEQRKTEKKLEWVPT